MGATVRTQLLDGVERARVVTLHRAVARKIQRPNLFKKRFDRELAMMGLPSITQDVLDGDAVTEQDLAHLPAVVRRYMMAMGVVGRVPDASMRAAWSGRFRMKPGADWMPMQAWQYNSGLEVARIFYITVGFAKGLVPTLGRDTYRHGNGRMLIRPLDLFTVVDGKGEEFDIGELVTYLNDLVLLAPSMLLRAHVTFTEVNEREFDVSLTDHERKVTARVVLDAAGRPTNFITTDRFVEDPAKAGRYMRCEWATPVDAWVSVSGGRLLPVTGRAEWHLAQGNFVYVEMGVEPGDVVYNVDP